MTVSISPTVQRIARILAKSAKVPDEEWTEHVEAARAVLEALRNPDQTVASVGDLTTWRAMINAALGDAPAAQSDTIAKPSDNQDHGLCREEKLDEGLIDSMDGSDRPCTTQPGGHGEPVPSFGYSEKYCSAAATAEDIIVPGSSGSF